MNNRYADAKKNVLVVKLSSMGDVIHTFPVVRAIKKNDPDTQIVWVVSDVYKELVELSPYVDEVILFRRKKLGKIWKQSVVSQIKDFIMELREREYDAVLDLQGLLRSALITYVARSKVKIGFSYAREGAPVFYNAKVAPIGENVHAIERYMSALPAFGIADSAEVEYGLLIPEHDLEWAKTVTPAEPFIVINPNSRWETKRWPSEKFGALALEFLRRTGLRSVIIGADDDKKRGAEVKAVAGSSAVDLTGSSGFARLSAVLKLSCGLVTNDSGPMHLAVALKTPVVALFGPTNPARTGPYGSLNRVISLQEPCAPCYKRVCPQGRECMETINVSDVMTAWDNLQTLGVRK